MRKPAAFLGGFIMAAALAESLAMAERPTSFFVAADGDDMNEGTREKPFATLTRARDAARLVGVAMDRRIVVRGGKYFDVSLLLGPLDSGLTIEAAPGETPVLYGRRAVTQWEKDGGPFYAARLPGARDPTWDFRCLVVNGEIRPRARLPRTGEFTHLNRFDARWHTTAGGGFRGADLPELKTGLQYQEGDLGPWLDVNNAEVTVFHQWDDSVVGIASHDPASRTLRFSNPSGYPPGAFGVRTYAVWNIREGMHEPGQWYLDRTRGMVVYWPKPGEDIHRLEVVAPTAEFIFKIEGTPEAAVSGVSLERLHLRASTTPLVAGGFAAAVFQGAVEARFIADCTLKALNIAGVGGQAIRIAHGASVVVRDCDITHAGAGGIYDSKGVRNRIIGNRILGIGRLYAGAIGIRVVGGGQKQPELSHDNEVSFNEVLHVPYVGIQFDGWKNRFERNLVHSAMEALRDGAAFYGAGRDNILRGNLVRNMPSGKPAHAYYIDELGEGIVIEENLSVNCEWPAHMHMATGNTLRNNLFISGGACSLTFPRSTGFVMDRNIVAAGGPIIIRNPDGVATWTNNLFFSSVGQYQRVPETVDRRDPLFVDAASGDYRFRAGSPALELGIKPLMASDVGSPRGAAADGAMPAE